MARRRVARCLGDTWVRLTGQRGAPGSAMVVQDRSGTSGFSRGPGREEADEVGGRWHLVPARATAIDRYSAAGDGLW